MVYICMLYYVIKYIFIVCDKYVYVYVYSNMYSIDYVIIFILELYIYIVVLWWILYSGLGG